MDDYREDQKLRELERAAHEQFLADIKAVFGSPSGKRFLEGLLDTSGVNAIQSLEPEKLIENAAVRNFVLEHILQPVLAADPSIYFDIIQNRMDELKKQEEQDYDS